MWNRAILPINPNFIETGTSSEESNTVRFAKIGKEEKIAILDFIPCLIFFSYKYLRVLLVKQPDISEPTFLTQYQIVYNMKSTYRINVPGTKIWNLGANTVPWGVLEILAPRQKQVNVPPTFF